MNSLSMDAAPLAPTEATSNLASNDSLSDPHLSSLDLTKPTLNVSLDPFPAPALLDLFQDLHDNASVSDFLLSFPPPGEDDAHAPVVAQLWRGVADLLRENRHLTSLDIVLGPHHVRDTLASPNGLDPVLDVLAPASDGGAGSAAANTTLRQLRLWLLGTSRTSATGMAIATPVARRAATIACRVVFQYDESAPAAVSAIALPPDSSSPPTNSRRGSYHRRPSKTYGDLSSTPSWPPAGPETAPTGSPRRDGRSDGFLQHLPFALNPVTVSPNGSRPLSDGAGGSDYLASGPAASADFTTADRTTLSSGTAASVYLSLGTEFGTAAASTRSSSPASVSDTLAAAGSVGDATQLVSPRSAAIVPPVVIVADDTEVERIPHDLDDTRPQLGSRASGLGSDASGAATPSPGSGSVTPSNRHIHGMRCLVSSSSAFPVPAAPVVICVDEPPTYVTAASPLRHPQQQLAAHPGAADLSNFYETDLPLQAPSMTSMVTGYATLEPARLAGCMLSASAAGKNVPLPDSSPGTRGSSVLDTPRADCAAATVVGKAAGA